ncbi:MAG: peptidylprolyl isomerase [Balneolaceae bacterium]
MENFGFMRTLCVLTALVFISCTGSSTSTKQNTSTTPSSNIVGSVGDQQVTYKELTSNFGAGSESSKYTLEELQDFLPIYLDYRAKILSARDEGYFEDERILSEYDVYSKQAAYAYWIENVIRPTLFEEYKSKFTKEMKSSHILIALDNSATADDTLEVYNQIIEARNKFLSGVPLSELDSEYSTTRQGRSMGGDLPWFSVGTTVKPFEDVLYSLEVGEISMPFRTQFGYHIVLLEDKRDRVLSREISHIFAQRGQGTVRLDSAYLELERGNDWSEVVKKYTQDVQSASTGGKIGWVNYGSRYNPDFIDTVMHINPSSPYSKPFNSSYGAHIIKIDSVQTFESPEAYDEHIMNQLEESRTFRKSNSFVVNWLKENFESIEHKNTLNEFITLLSSLDTTKVSDIKLTRELASKNIYEFETFSYTVQDFLDYLISSGKGPLSSNYKPAWYLSFQEYVIDTNLTQFTINELPEFVDQTENYKSGLVVYQINEDSVWSATTVDSTKLMDLYLQNPADYSYDKRYFYHLISSSRDTTIQKAIDFVLAGNSPDSIRANGIMVGVVSDSTGTFQGEPFNKLEDLELNSFSEIFEYNNRKAVFYLNEILPARKMLFEEAFNKLLAEYQPVREQKWLSNLRKMYEVKLYPENLSQAYQVENNTQ